MIPPFKTCGCGATYATREDWNRLEFAGEQHTEDETGRYRLEMRHCGSCASTLGIDELITPPPPAPSHFAVTDAMLELTAYRSELEAQVREALRENNRNRVDALEKRLSAVALALDALRRQPV